MACEQATRRGGLSNITDSMWLVQAFQGWYVADALYNEVNMFALVACKYTDDIPARYPYYNGYHNGWVWIHAFRW